MINNKSLGWTTLDSAKLYGVNRWGNSYFDISESGDVTVKTLGAGVPITNIIEGIKDRDLNMPVLLRIENILDAQIKRLNNEFSYAIKKHDYQSPYQGVYPIKVNQQAHVVEEIARFGSSFNQGFEVGSKPEMMAALSSLKNQGSLIICNGYKDKEFIALGLHATKLGYQCFFVIETITELPIIIQLSKEMRVKPNIGVRVKMTSQVSGHWKSTSGDRSVFGLTNTQLIDVLDTLKQENLLHCFKLLHCHIGSQIPSIAEVRNGVIEACRYYVDLINEGAALSYIDLGGGLAVDYTGEMNCANASRNYTLNEYCENIVEVLKKTFDSQSINHPTIITESGRATVAYSSILLFNTIDVNTFDPISVDEANEEEHYLLKELRDISKHLNPMRIQECYNDVCFYRDQVRDLFKCGQISLRERSIADNLFLELLHQVAAIMEEMKPAPPVLKKIKNSLADIYYGNFSLFQSLPDVWSIDQVFPVMPIHRLNEKPLRQAMLADITCDCDGKIDDFANGIDKTKTLPVHPLKENEEYYLGVFLVGAYQEALGGLHNSFGDINVVNVRLAPDGTFEFVQEIQGDTVANVLSYAEYIPDQMTDSYKDYAEKAVQDGRITTQERQEIIQAFNSSMQGYTYYERE